MIVSIQIYVFAGENKPIWMQAEEREENKVGVKIGLEIPRSNWCHILYDYVQKVYMYIKAQKHKQHI